MAMTDLEAASIDRRGGSVGASRDDWRLFGEVTDFYRCRVWVKKQQNGRFRAASARFPELVAECDTVEDAVNRVVAGYGLTIESYLAADEPLPVEQSKSEQFDGATEYGILAKVNRARISPVVDDERVAAPSEDELRQMATDASPPAYWLEQDEERPF